MLRGFIFDIGNVLLKFDFGIALRRLESHCSVPVAECMPLLEELKTAYESGRIDRADFQHRAQKILGFKGREEDFVSAWQEIFSENGPMLDLVRSLHGRYPLYLLSNTSDLHMDYVLRSYPVFSLFTDAVYSYRAGCVKPEPQIYQVALEQFGLEPYETFFIDDLAANIATARELGIHSHHYDFNRHELLMADLKPFGVV